MKYPPPSHAAMIWVVGEKFFVAFQGHTIQIDIDNKGWNFLASTLKARTPSTKIAEPGAPTQWTYDRTKGPNIEKIAEKLRTMRLEDIEL